MRTDFHNPTAIDQATIDRAIARAKLERSRAVLAAFRSLFGLPSRLFGEARPTGQSRKPA